MRSSSKILHKAVQIMDRLPTGDREDRASTGIPGVAGVMATTAQNGNARPDRSMGHLPSARDSRAQFVIATSGETSAGGPIPRRLSCRPRAARLCYATRREMPQSMGLIAVAGEWARSRSPTRVGSALSRPTPFARTASDWRWVRPCSARGRYRLGQNQRCRHSRRCPGRRSLGELGDASQLTPTDFDTLFFLTITTGPSFHAEFKGVRDKADVYVRRGVNTLGDEGEPSSVIALNRRCRLADKHGSRGLTPMASRI